MGCAQRGGTTPLRNHARLSQQVTLLLMFLALLFLSFDLDRGLMYVILMFNLINVSGFFNPNAGSGVYYTCPAGLASHSPGASVCFGTSFKNFFLD